MRSGGLFVPSSEFVIYAQSSRNYHGSTRTTLRFVVVVWGTGSEPRVAFFAVQAAQLLLTLLIATAVNTNSYY